MDFKIITFKELLEKKFNIPSYQRGYRWEKENVEALLNDIQEFADKKNKEDDEFYCLQPVVVKKNIKLSTDEDEGDDVYDLLDGQQRLTTLWLILNTPRFLRLWDDDDPEHPQPYNIQYESRENLFEKAIDINIDSLENIDLFYLRKAFETIKDWKGKPSKILNCLVPNNITTDSHNVRVIWYEFDEGEQSSSDNKQSSSIKVFSRLNYGKISLTDTELIKALILQSDIYPDDESSHSKNIMKERLFRIATEWDDIEKGLHNEQLWGMLAPANYNPANHIELLLKFVAKQIQTENNYAITDSQRRDFYTISKYLGLNANIPPAEYAQRVENLWTKIRDAYNAIRNWYTNDDFYHLIGLYVLLKNSTDDTITLVEEIYKQYTCQENDKNAFQTYLKNEIGKLIQMDSHLQLQKLVYGEHNSKMIKILEVLNVYLYLTNKNLDSRFNFRKFKDFNVISLEHIHPQHLNFEEDVKYEDAKEWYTNTYKIILSNAEYKNDAELSGALTALEEKLSSQEKFKTAKSDCQKAVEKIDLFFDTKAGIKDHMHTLYNITLVDKATNAALSNNLIDVKRFILQEREENNQTYVPLATNYVFNKYFSKTISDMKFWTKDDREAYFEVLKKAYEFFTKEI